MRVLVTGASGFVGSHLVPALVDRGHDVVATVRREGSAPPGAAESVVGAIDGETEWGAALDGIDAVVHLAARVHVMRDDASDPLTEFRRVNTAGTSRLLDAALERGVKRFVFLSTIKVNGEKTTDHPFDAHSPRRPVDPYAQSKAEAEALLLQAADRGGIDVVIVRTPLVYGPGVGGNFHSMLTIAKTAAPIPVGSIRNRRTMTSVWNLADAIASALVAPPERAAILVAADATSTSTAEVVAALRKALHRPAGVIPFPVRLLRLLGRVAARTSFVDRLTDSLEVVPGTTSTKWHWAPPYSTTQSLEWTVSGSVPGARRPRPEASP